MYLPDVDRLPEVFAFISGWDMFGELRGDKSESKRVSRLMNELDRRLHEDFPNYGISFGSLTILLEQSSDSASAVEMFFEYIDRIFLDSAEDGS
jgi:hypothetical protein